MTAGWFCPPRAQTMSGSDRRRRIQAYAPAWLTVVVVQCPVPTALPLPCVCAPPSRSGGCAMAESGRRGEARLITMTSRF